MSSRSISLLRDYFPVNSKSFLSFNPNFNSGIPLKADLIFTAPITSDLNTVPLFKTKIFNFSITSRKISFFWCFTPSVLHETALLAAVGTDKF